MPRKEPFTCPHPDAAYLQYVATFSQVQRVKICNACAKKINDDFDDRRGVGSTKAAAAAIRDPKLGVLSQ